MSATTSPARKPLTVADIRAAERRNLEVRPDRGPHCPPQVRVTVRGIEYGFQYSSSLSKEPGGRRWRFAFTSTYGNTTWAVSPADMGRYGHHTDASGVVVGGALAKVLDELVAAAA